MQLTEAATFDRKSGEGEDLQCRGRLLEMRNTILTTSAGSAEYGLELQFAGAVTSDNIYSVNYRELSPT